MGMVIIEVVTRSHIAEGRQGGEDRRSRFVHVVLFVFHSLSSTQAPKLTMQLGFLGPMEFFMIPLVPLVVDE